MGWYLLQFSHQAGLVWTPSRLDCKTFTKLTASMNKNNITLAFLLRFLIISKHPLTNYTIKQFNRPVLQWHQTQIRDVTRNLIGSGENVEPIKCHVTLILRYVRFSVLSGYDKAVNKVTSSRVVSAPHWLHSLVLCTCDPNNELITEFALQMKSFAKNTKPGKY